ncbi:MAG: GGDEF domain-containing protein [Gammaproteobacteria bacterium]|nr:GGDEF domain-containing protein [Gammaproteobacteria bacterium]
MLDIDHFKTINDSYGHNTGDNVLRGLGAYFQKRVRGADSVFHIGSEEFVILLNDTTATTAHRVVENMRKEIALLPLLSEQAVTISVGIAELQPEDDINNWLKCADKNLYKAKSAGRNQVAVCNSKDSGKTQDKS